MAIIYSVWLNNIQSLFFIIIQMTNTIKPIIENFQWVKNQFTICWDKVVYLQSYESVVVKIDFNNSIITFWKDFDYSRTTMKYVKQFFEFYTSFKGDIKSIRDYIKRWTVGQFIVYSVRYDENLAIELK